MAEDPFDFFERFFQEIFNLSQRIATPPHPYATRAPPDAHFVREGREIIPYGDRWIMVEELGMAVKESETEVRLVEDENGRYITVENPITKTKRRYKLAKNMTGKFEWSIRNGYFQLDLYISNGEDDGKTRET